MSPYKAFISSIASTCLKEEEKAFINEHQPWGFILFSRNIDHEDPTQLRRLTNALREITGRENLPLFVDQEGGRVQRLRPPLVPHYPPASLLGKLYRYNQDAGIRAAFLLSRLHAFDLRRFGLNANCLPLLDVPSPKCHNVIGNRAYGSDATMVGAMGEAAANGLLAGGILPVMKHVPGHGRAQCDTHLELAHVTSTFEVLQTCDFVPFQHLRHLPAAMSAHIVYEAIDRTQPATLSKKIIEEIVRGVIGFDGLLLSDDLSMQALSGSLAYRTKASLSAGCDMVLYCQGQIAEMREVAQAVPLLANKALLRAQTAQACIYLNNKDDEEKELREEFSALINQVELKDART